MPSTKGHTSTVVGGETPHTSSHFESMLVFAGVGLRVS